VRRTPDDQHLDIEQSSEINKIHNNFLGFLSKSTTGEGARAETKQHSVGQSNNSTKETSLAETSLSPNHSGKNTSTKGSDAHPNVTPVDQNHNAIATVNSHLFDWYNELASMPAKATSSIGLGGFTTLAFSVILPALTLIFGLILPKRVILVLLNHPLETLAEIILLLSIPLINYFVWSALAKSSVRYPKSASIGLGISIGTSLIVSTICGAGLFFGCQNGQAGAVFDMGFTSIGFMYLLAALAGIYLAKRVSAVIEFPRLRKQVVYGTAIGVTIALIAFAGAEARGWCIRLAERMAISNSPTERKQGLSFLRQLSPERELKMDCADDRAVGLPGLFIPLKPTSLQELYFAVTGKPYTYGDSADSSFAAMSDENLHHAVVGDKIHGLSLTRSSMTGVVHPETLASTIDWTMVFKNESIDQQEARAELRVPQDAVITDLTLWTKGEPQEATFAASGKAQGDNNVIQANHDCPAMLTDLGRGRVLLHCYPVSQDEELKVKVTMVVPLQAEGDQAASLVLPRFSATNFDLLGEQSIRLRSASKLSSTLVNLKQDTIKSGENVLCGDFKEHQLDGLDMTVLAEKPNTVKSVAMLDMQAVQLKQEDERRKLDEEKANAEESNKPQQVVVMIDGSKGVKNQLSELQNVLSAKAGKDSKKNVQVKTVKPEYVVQSIKPVIAASPKNLIVVLDGSASLKKHIPELQASLAKLPSKISASLIVASQEQGSLINPVPLSQGLKTLNKVDFVGGQNNLKALVKASELAGESAGGTVLWIHGPQPALNNEIYIMAPYVSTPAFFELPIDSGDTDTSEFFKNHSEIGPFVQVPRNAELAKDVDSFLANWQPGRVTQSAVFAEQTTKPNDCKILTGLEAKELLALHANQKTMKLAANRQWMKAARIAVTYGLITPVSSALVIEGTNSDADPSANSSTQTEQADHLTADELTNETSNSVPAPAAHAAPHLGGASNSTIGSTPISSGGYGGGYVSGVNAAGSVRVNNLANLEAIFNIIANLLELGCASIGVVVLLQGLALKTTNLNLFGREISFSPRQTILLGIVMILFGLAVPGIVNEFVASARDTNLFS
jgi:hypothetical protein